MLELNVNWWAVIAAVAVNMVVGALWYSDVLFAKPWMKLIGKSKKELGEGASSGYVITAFAALLQAFLLVNIVLIFGAATAWDGAMLGAAVWVGFVGATTISQAVFAHQPMKLWAINSGYYLAALIINGAIFAVWR